MKLKGRNVDRFPPEKRARMERTLKRMELTRRNDEMRLRELINAKRDWTIKENQKGLDVLKQFDEQIERIEEQKEDIRKQMIKLDGCLLVLDDLIVESAKLEKEEQKRAQEEAAKKAAAAKPKKKTTSKKSTKKT